MPFLVVTARSGGGRSVSVRKARNRPALAADLRKEKLLLLSAYELPRWAAGAATESRLKLADHAVLNDQLAQLLSRGVPLVEALEVAASTVRGAAREPVERLKELVAAGTSFSDACGKVGGFDIVTIAVYKASERTGDLAGSARQLATNARRTLAVAGKAVTLMIYPAIVLSIALLVALAMMTIILPNLAEGLANAGVPLPGYTRVLISSGEWIRDNALLLLVAVAVAIVAVYVFRAAIGPVLMNIARRTPLLRDVVLAQESARFFSVMAAMSRSGVPLADALGTANQAINHPDLRSQMERLRTRLVEGGVLRLLIDEVVSLPLSTRRLLIAAERSGDMETAFSSLAGDMIEEVERKSQRALAVLQPLLIVIMFLIIGSLLASIMLPLITLPGKIGL
ncbi:MAG: type II secretion system F family protein [Phycisphaerales bacterium]